MPDDVKLADHCREIVAQLLESDGSHADSPSHIEEKTTLADHLLTTSALVACLAYDEPERDLLRLAALVHDMPPQLRQENLGNYADAAMPWIELLEQQGQAIEQKKALQIPAEASKAKRALLLAHLAASKPIEIKTRAEFEAHPLNAGEKVALVYGGATKIKGYVSESAKLPEIRGASVLLDHINQLHLPAMWGRKPTMTQHEEIGPAQEKEYGEVRKWFTKQAFAQNKPPLDAPECIIYASGGNILALAPANWGQRMATAIEWCYTDVTKVANSVAVSQCFSLLELQYGRYPSKFWIDDAEALAEKSAEAAKLLQQSLGRKADNEERTFAEKKGFGELVTVMAGLANRRRAGDGTHTGSYRYTPFFGLSSHARKCTSCDIRPAAEFMGDDDGRYLCVACHKKYQAGRWAKKSDQPRSIYKWIRPWHTWLEEKEGITVEGTADDLQKIGAASKPDGFVGLISADGNDVGAYIATLTSISGYRNFSKKMLEANEDAVAKALAKYVQPNDLPDNSWPFEVIAIGGDDVILFVPADKAVEVAQYIAQEFELGLKKRDIEGITLSAGVLLMPQSTPIRFATELADNLLKSSKKIRYNNAPAVVGGGIGATVDFMALKSVTMVAETIALYRKAALEHKGRKNLRFTQRPYTLEQLQKVIDATKALQRANFPRSQLYQLAEYIRKGLLMRSAVDYAYLVQRGKERRGKEVFEQFDQLMIELCNENDNWLPWRILDQKESPEWDYDTPLLDIIELYPFIAAGKSEKGEEA